MNDYNIKPDNIENTSQQVNQQFFTKKKDNKTSKSPVKNSNPEQIIHKPDLHMVEHSTITGKELDATQVETQQTAAEIKQTAKRNFQSKIAPKPVVYKKWEIRTRDIIPTEKIPLGEGSSGSVHQHRTNTDLVVKKSYDKLELEQEYEIGYRLDHPNLVKMHQLHIKEPETGESKKYKLTMDKIDGKTLWSLRENQQQISPKVAVELVLQAKNCCLYLLDQQVSWEDLNPDNIFMTTKGNRLVLIDFAYWHKFPDLRTGAMELLLGSMAIAREIVTTVSGIHNKETSDAVQEMIFPKDFFGYEPPNNIPALLERCKKTPWVEDTLNKIAIMSEKEIETFFNNYFDLVIKALERPMPENLAKGSLATNILDLAKAYAAKLKIEPNVVSIEASEIKKRIELYFSGIERLPQYEKIFECILSIIKKEINLRRSMGKPHPHAFGTDDLLRIVAIAIASECEVSTLSIFERDLKKLS